MNDISHDVIVIGAGAAGLMAAAGAARRGRKVLVLDHNDEPGAKIVISGGGRCNFTNRQVVAERFVSANPHFAKSALKRFTPLDFLALIDHYRIAFHERELGQLFCDGSARQIVDLLLSECAAGGVEFRLGIKVGEVAGDGPYRVGTTAGGFSSSALVVATGGLSIPKIGATGFAHRLAERYGLGVTEVRPALVPLTFSAADLDFMRLLAGIAVEAKVSCGKTSFREALLFTHRGLSGPSILQISSYWREGRHISVNLLPDCDLAPWLIERKTSRAKAEVKTILGELLPARLAEGMAERADLTGQPIADITNKALISLGQSINDWQLLPAGTEGYRTAEATLGGVDTAGLSSKTMEAKTHPGLFFIGEATDVTGWLGGYNFQWAWSSGWVAGEHA